MASLLGGLSGYLVLLVASHVLDTERNADFLTFWSLLFWSFGTIGGLQNETTRAVSSAAGGNREPGTPGAAVLPVGALVGAAVGAVGAATSFLWGPRILGPSWPVLTVVLCLAVVAYAGQSALLGALAGSRAWSGYARLVSSEAAIRVALVGVAGLVGARTVGLEAAAAAAAATWVLMLALDPAARRAARSHADVGVRGLLRNVGHSLLASTASAALVVGFTVLVRATTPADEFSTAAPFILAIAVTRAPLLVPLTAYQGVAITYFLAHRSEGVGALRRFAGLIAAFGAVAAVAAALVGPWLMRTLFGPGYGVAGAYLAGLTLAGAGLALLTLTGAAVLALGDHRRYSAGWVVATLVALVILLLPLPLEPRVIVTLIVGPLVGAALHAVAIARLARTTR